MNTTKDYTEYYKKRVFNYHNNKDKELEKHIFYQAKDRAKNKKLEFNIELSDIIIPKICPVLGIEVRPAYGGKPTPNSPSIDRIDSNIGYVKGNIRIISYRANAIKNNGTIEEHEKIIKYMKNNLNKPQDKKELIEKSVTTNNGKELSDEDKEFLNMPW